MLNVLKYIVSFVLVANLLISSVGLNVFAHSCKSADIVEYSLVDLSSDNGIDCQYCSESEEAHSCAMEEPIEMDCCSEEEPQAFAEEKENSECCDESSEFLKLDIETISFNDIIVINPQIELFTINSDLSFSDYSVPQTGSLTHHSGISPPYESNYIPFIASFLE